MGGFLLAGRPTVASAIPPAVIPIATAAASVISAVLEYSKRSGDLELEIAAFHEKLDAILKNQIMLINAISEISIDLSILLREVARIPVNVIDLGSYYNAVAVTKILADARARNDNERVLDALKLAYKTAVDVETGSRNAEPPPNLALAARHLLLAIQTLGEIKAKLPKAHAGTLSDTAVRVRSALESLTAETGIRTRLPEHDAAIDRSVESLGQARFKILPAKLKFEEGVLEEGGGTVFRTWLERSAGNAILSVMFCVSSPPSAPVFIKQEDVFVAPPRRYIGHDPGDGGSDEPRRIGTRRHWYSSRTLTYRRYLVIRKDAFGNIPYYTVKLDDAVPPMVSSWKQYVFNYDIGGGYIEEGHDDPNELAQCPELSLGAKERDWLDFQARLDNYNGCVALKSRILAIQDRAEADLTLIRKVQDRL
jgi:hypothetical protein